MLDVSLTDVIFKFLFYYCFCVDPRKTSEKFSSHFLKVQDASCRVLEENLCDSL